MAARATAAAAAKNPPVPVVWTVDSEPAQTPALIKLHPGWKATDEREAVMVDLPASAGAYFPDRRGQDGKCRGDSVLGIATGEGECPLERRLPEDRTARYGVLRIMSKDPTIDSALKMHLANALSAKKDTGEMLFLEPKDGPQKKDKIVDDLNAALMPIIREQVMEWARKAALYGWCPVRVYGAKGKGVTSVRSDYYTHPRFVSRWLKGGKLAGYTASYQGTSPRGMHKIKLLPPWYFVDFEIPEKDGDEAVEPISVGFSQPDLSLDDYELESLTECQEYGTSIIGTAFSSWMDLLDAICSLAMSRRNAARLERIIGISTGKLDPERASRYIGMISQQISSASAQVERQSYLRGNVQTVVNHFVPVFGEKGSVQIDAVAGTPDINGLEDVNFHIKRLGSALGIDPALLGFGDFLAGGLGDGGFFRVSVLAATKANLIRLAVKNGIQRLCEIHCAYKHGKVFLPGEEPWQIRFNSISSAIEREEQEALEARAGLAGSLIGSIATLDQEFSITDKRGLMSVLWRLMRLDDKDFEEAFPKNFKPEPAPGMEGMEEGGFGAAGGMAGGPMAQGAPAPRKSSAQKPNMVGGEEDFDFEEDEDE